jgi:hypothetical protein
MEFQKVLPSDPSIVMYAKIAVNQGRSPGLEKDAIYDAIMKRAEALRADGESQQQAFSKVITEDETGRLLYQACATWRLNSMLWERCLAMAFILQKPSYQVNSLGPNSPASGAHSIQTSFEPSTFFPAAAPAQSVLPCSEPQIISNHPNFESTTRQARKG